MDIIIFETQSVLTTSLKDEFAGSGTDIFPDYDD